MSSTDVGTAFVVIRPDMSLFQKELQAQVTAATAKAVGSVRVNPTLTALNTAGGSVGANTGVAAAAATANLRGIEKSSEAAAKGMISAKNESRILQGSLVGLARVTPVAVFGLGVVGTAAIAAGLAIKSSINSAAELQTQLNLFQAVTGSTSQQMERVSSVATQLGGDLTLPATSANDAAVALTELAKAGLSVEDAIDASRGVLQLAAAANISAGEAAKLAATELNAFGLAGSEAVRVTDLLAGASIAAQGEIGDFAQAFQQTASAAATADISVETTTGLLTELARAGIRGADAGTSLRTTILRLVPTTKEAAQFQKALGIELDRNATIGSQLPSLIEQYRTALLRLPPVDRIEALNQIFGQDAFRAASIFFNQAPGELARVTDEVNKVGSGAKLAEARTTGFAGAIEGLKSSSQTLGTSLGSAVLPPLTEITKTLSTLTTEASSAVTALKPLGSAVQSSFSAVAGGAQGTVLLAGIGVVAKKLFDARATAKAVAVANEAAAKTTLVSWEVAEAQLTAATIAAADKQIAAATAVGAANVRAAGVAGAAWKLEATVATVAAGSAVKRILGSNKGLVAGLVATIAGSQLSQNKDGVSGVSQIGSILQTAGTGALIGSVGGAPGIAVGTAVGTTIGAINVVVSEGKRNKQKIKDKFDTLTFDEQQAFLATLGQPERDAIGRIAGQRNPGDLGLSAAAFIAKNGLSPKASPFAASNAAILASIAPPTSLQDVAAGQFSGTASLAADAIKSFGGFLRNATSVSKQATTESEGLRQSQIDLSLAIANLSGSTQQITSALKAQIVLDKQKIAAIEDQLTDFTGDKALGKVGKTVKERTDLNNQLAVLYGELGASEKALNSAIEEVAAFVLPVNLTIATIRAGSTANLQDNLAADQAIVSAYRAQLSSTKATGSELDALKVNLAQAEAQVVRDISSIAAQSKANADKIVEEQKNKAAEQEFLRQTILDIQTQRLGNRLAAALATPGTDDEKRVFNDQIKLFEVQRDRAVKLRNEAIRGSQAQADARKQIVQLDGEIADVRRKIKNLGKDSAGGGFSINDLFKEALNQFNEFGSNVSSSVTTPGGVRGALGGAIAAQNPKLTQADSMKISEARTTNDLLNEILNTLKVGETHPEATASSAGSPVGAFTASRARVLAGSIRGN